MEQDWTPLLQGAAAALAGSRDALQAAGIPCELVRMPASAGGG